MTPQKTREMTRGKGIILLFCVCSLLPKVASVEKSKRERAIANDRNEKSENATEVAAKGNLGSTFFPTEMKSNRSAKLNLGDCRLKVKWF